MFAISVNWLAIVVATLASMAVGFVWFSPGVFGSAWMAEIGRSPDEMGASPTLYLWTLLAAFVTAYILALFIGHVGNASLVSGLLAGLVAGVGFVATSFATHAIFHSYTLRHWLITAGHQVVSLAVMGTILGAWR